MKCRVVRRHIGDYLDGRLSATQHEALRCHISGCPHCRTLLDESRRIRELLSCPILDISPPSGLAERIKQQARVAQEEAQIRARPAAQAIGSPAFVATCASLFMGALMCYVVITQVYVTGLGRGLQLDSPVIIARAPADDVTQDPPAGSRTSPVVANEPRLAALPTPVARPVSLTVPAPSRPRARPAAAPAPHRERRARRVEPRVSRQVPETRLAMASIEEAPSVVEQAPHIPAVPAETPAPAATRLARSEPMIEGPADRVAPAGTRAPRPPVAEVAVASVPTPSAGDEVGRGVVAGIVANYVVEKYVVERIIESEPTLLAVTTSTPSSTGTVLTERMKQ